MKESRKAENEADPHRSTRSISHTFHPRDIKSVVEEYVNAAHEAGFREVRLIHGRGRGVQRGIVQAALEKHPLVESFDDAPDSHLGATIATLRERLAARARRRSEARVARRRARASGGGAREQ